MHGTTTPKGPGLALDRLHAAKVAARLRGYIAEHDRKRRLRQELILALDAYCYRMKFQNMVAADVVGRLRKKAAEYEHNAERVRRQPRRSAIKSGLVRAAA